MRYKIGRDKWKHFWVGIPLGAILQAFCLYYLTSMIYASIAAFVLLVIICYGFELFSLITKLGHHDLVDAVAGILGGIIGMALATILRMQNVF